VAGGAPFDYAQRALSNVDDGARGTSVRQSLDMPASRKNPARLACLSAFLLLLLCAEHSPIAQQRFEGRVDRIVVDFLAIGKDGTPVRDLVITEINLQVDGKRRAIAALDLVDLRGTRVGTNLQSASAPVPANPSAHDIASGGRKFFLVFDEDSMRPGEEREPQQSAMRFVKALRPDDQVSVLALPGGNVATELTIDRSTTIRALEGILGRMPRPPETDQEAVNRACADYHRTRITLSKLSDLMRSLGRIDGPKFVVFTTSGMLPQGGERASGGPACAVLTVDPERFQEVGMLAMAARAQFFVIQPHQFLLDAAVMRMPGFFGHPGDDNVGHYLADQLGGLRDVAGVTGGESFRLSGFGDPVFARIERETSAHYVLSFAPIAAERDDKLHKIAVTTGRKGIDIRARPTFRLPKA